MRPETRYARNGDLSIAYQLFGDGPTDLVVTFGFVSHARSSGRIPGRQNSCAGFLQSRDSVRVTTPPSTSLAPW